MFGENFSLKHYVRLDLQAIKVKHIFMASSFLIIVVGANSDGMDNNSIIDH